MRYPYQCQDCSHEFDVIKSIRDIENIEACQACNSLQTTRLIGCHTFYGAGHWDKAEYNPGLGQIIKNPKHRAEVAKRKGLIEVGNEDFDKTCERLDKRADERVEEQSKPALDALEYGLKKEMGKI